MDDNLIFDLGVSDGKDTAYYLAKGFDVVGVEADPDMFAKMSEKFASYIRDGRLFLLNNAASSRSGEIVSINVHQVYQGISGINFRTEPGGYKTHDITSIGWKDLVGIRGVPRYMKIDIEGSEEAFLNGIENDGDLPEFVSVEAYQFEPIRKLHSLGYSRFVMIDQNPPGGLALPAQQYEGTCLVEADFGHASGPFGLDIFCNKDWQTFEDIYKTWTTCSLQFDKTWYDCHAWKPKD